MHRTIVRTGAGITMLLAAATGLASRTAPLRDWPVIGSYGGDACWTIAACGGLRLILTGTPTRWLALAGYAISVGVELSQLVRWDWLDAIRATTPGALLLGRGFLWSDLAAYAGGAVAWAFLDASFRRTWPGDLPSDSGSAGP